MNMYEPPVAQTPRRQRNGVYVNGTNVMRPASRDGSSYVRENSPAFAMPSLTRANTASAVSEMNINKSRLPRQSTVGTGMSTGQHRLSRQSTRESMIGSARASASTSSSVEKETTVRSQQSNSSEGNTPVTLTPVAEARMRREARHAHTSSMSSASNGIRSGTRQGPGQGQSQPQVEVTVNRRTTARRQATGDDRWG